LLPILDGAHEAKTMRDGSVVVALDPDTAEFDSVVLRRT
jgi:hypothetical protein